MDAIKIFVIILFFLGSNFIFGQKSIYPKNTIFLKFKDTIFENKKMKSKSIHNFQGKNGIKFWWKGKWMFYDKKHTKDTLCFKHLKNYHFSNLKEIREKEISWVEKKYANLKYKPYSGSKNAVFKTYLIEIISKKKFVIYPVIWRNEGIIK
jgi:hypothetical protein